ncbi:MAG: phosphoribosylglycinamide formyltransferase [Bacteroidetes bacterium]|nr:phosphoribosylglycinamide formyltransferase [Bacteroidota bacterium]
MHKLLFFASGSGSNFQSVIDSIEHGQLNASIVGLITDRADAGAIERAGKHSIMSYVVPPLPKDTFSEQLLKVLAPLEPDLIVLAGYLQKIPASVTETYRGRMINIHPSLLPKYGGKGCYGIHVHRAVIHNRESVSGCTVHFVNDHYDRGKIIAQKEVPVSADETPDTLARKVLEEEHKLLPKTIRQLLTNQLT